MRNLRNSTIYLILLGLLNITLIYPQFNLNEPFNNKFEAEDNQLKNSGYWVLPPININDMGFGDYTWVQAASQPWCSGSGTWNNPYIIENVTIVGASSNSLSIEYSTKHFIVRNCTFTNSGGGVAGGIKLYATNNGILYNNTCINNLGSGIRLEVSHNNTISDCITSHNSDGIDLYADCDDNRIYNCKIRNNIRGIYLNSGCDRNEIKNNIIINNTHITYESQGINVAYSHFNEIYNNTLIGSGDYGIEIYGSRNNSIQKNKIYNSKGTGLYLYYSESNNVSMNLVSNNSLNGIELYSDTYFNQISSNAIINNFQYGVYIDIGGGYCIHNYFYNNSFIGNGENARDRGGSPSVRFNEWNSTTIGNYWDDYLGVDANDDGIGDTPHSIPALYSGCVDNLPIWRDGPDITIISPLPNEIFGTLSPDFEISLNKLYVNTTWYTIDDGKTNYTFTELSGTINQTAWDNEKDGLVFIRFYAKDLWGYIKYSEVEIQKDTSKPIILIYSPTPNQFCGIIAPTFNITVIDNSSTSSWYSLNNGLNITFSGFTGVINQTEWDKIGNGTVTIRFYANDSLGLEGFAVVVIRKDIKAPNTTIHFSLHSGINIVNESTFFSFSADDGLGIGVALIEYKINDSSWFNYTAPFTLSSFPYGDNLISYQAIDQLNNIESIQTILVFRTDTFDPVSSISFTPYRGINEVIKSTSFSLNADDGIGSGVAMIRYRINNSGWIDYIGPFNLSNYIYGDYLITYQSIDVIGNIENEKSILVVLVEEPSQPAISGYYIFILLFAISLITVYQTRRKIQKLK
ncbi:MAG: nitrous oxide reductase family maturation protein NosD [Candidatus Odinarchaeota archaeon]